MAQGQRAVIVVDTDSDPEETPSFSKAAVSLGTYSSDLEISTSSVEEISIFKLSKDICLCCGRLEIHTQHPLFHGGMCAPCSERFLERFFLCDDDGYQADCTICCCGKSLIMCDDAACHRCFCEECVDTLVYPGCAEEIKETSPWICFMCAPQGVNGLLKRRTKWRADLKHFYDQESNSPNIWIYQPLSPWERKSIHVLSLFDNITEELKSLGFLGERRGNGYLKYVDDVTDVIRIHIEEWGPFDFIFGSTPPVGKFYKHPSAWYFYQFFRILQYGSPEEKSKKPFFWLFVDNIVLDKAERDAASRFFQNFNLQHQVRTSQQKLERHASRILLPRLKSRESRPDFFHRELGSPPFRDSAASSLSATGKRKLPSPRLVGPPQSAEVEEKAPGMRASCCRGPGGSSASVLRRCWEGRVRVAG
ncbi:DNA (cytosine-5)-methyltransferase 3-like [Candoia aspera]|uniref:DNA (cytosine-5)-methyltransferase 3-like n=1 Tax=Candoia aspera TaxID=51853 RepID=UPI002FD7B179